MTAAGTTWQEAFTKLMRTIKTFCAFGCDETEFQRLLSNLARDHANDGDTEFDINSEEVIFRLMDNDALNITTMDPRSQSQLLQTLIKKNVLTREGLLQAARNLLAFSITEPEPPNSQANNENLNNDLPAGPTRVLILSPKTKNNETVTIDVNEVYNIIKNICREPASTHHPEPPIPDHLLTEHQTTRVTAANDQITILTDKNEWEKRREKQQLTNSTIIDSLEATTRSHHGDLLELSNGTRFRHKHMKAENDDDTIFIRCRAMGGRSCEELPGSTLLATKCLVEAANGLGNAKSRTELGLFCAEKQIQARLDCSEESTWIDISVPSKNLSSAFELLHCLLDRKVRPDDVSLKRATNNLLQAGEANARSLEGAATTALTKRIYSGDLRFLDVGPRMQWLSPEEVGQGLNHFRAGSALEICLAGNYSNAAEIEKLAHTHIGSLPRISELRELHSPTLPRLQPGRDVINLPSTSCCDEGRAVGLLAGPAPNRWGHDHSASWTSPRFSGSNHFACVAVILEVINSRLFNRLRDELSLTYDASFSVAAFDRLSPSHWIVAVTSTPEKLDPALTAAREVINDVVKGVRPITSRELENAIKSLKSHLTEAKSTAPYWVESLCHLSHKGTTAEKNDDIEMLLDTLTLDDLQKVAREFKSGSNDVAEVLAYSGQIRKNKEISLDQSADKAGCGSQQCCSVDNQQAAEPTSQNHIVSAAAIPDPSPTKQEQKNSTMTAAAAISTETPDICAGNNNGDLFSMD